MSDTLMLVLAGLAGGVLGAVFFGGLWWTVRRGLASTQPALWFVGSLVLRTGVVVGGFSVVGGRHWERLLMCLLGFVAARVLATWLTRPIAAVSGAESRQVTHAP